MRRRANDVVIRTEIGFEEDLMRRLIEGTLNISLMYTPSHCPGLVVERLFGETLVLVSTRPSDTGPGEDYSYIEWGRVSMPSMCRAILTSSDRRRSPTSAGLASRSRSPTETAASCPPPWLPPLLSLVACTACRGPRSTFTLATWSTLAKATALYWNKWWKACRSWRQRSVQRTCDVRI